MYALPRIFRIVTALLLQQFPQLPRNNSPAQQRPILIAAEFPDRKLAVDFRSQARKSTYVLTTFPRSYSHQNS